MQEKRDGGGLGVGGRKHKIGDEEVGQLWVAWEERKSQFFLLCKYGSGAARSSKKKTSEVKEDNEQEAGREHFTGRGQEGNANTVRHCRGACGT